MAQGFAIAVRLIDEAAGPIGKINQAIAGIGKAVQSANSIASKSVSRTSVAAKTAANTAAASAHGAAKKSGGSLYLIKDGLKDLRKEAKEAGAGFLKAFAPFESLALGGGIGGVIAGAGLLAQNFASAGSSILRMSQSLGLSVVDLQNWRGAADLAGVGADSMSNSLQGLAHGIYMARNGLNPDLFRAAQQFGINLNKGATDAEKAQNVLLQVADKIRNDPALRGNVQAQHTLLSVLGIDDKMLPLLQQGRVAIEQYIQEAKKNGSLTEKQAAGAASLMMAYTGLQQSIESTGYAIGAQIGQWLTPMLNKWREWLNALRSTGDVLGPVRKMFEGLANVDWSKVGADLAHGLLGDGSKWQATGSKMVDWIVKGLISGSSALGQFSAKVIEVGEEALKAWGKAASSFGSVLLKDLMAAPEMKKISGAFEEWGKVSGSVFANDFIKSIVDTLNLSPLAKDIIRFFRDIFSDTSWMPGWLQWMTGGSSGSGKGQGGPGGISGPTPTAPTPQSRAELQGIAGGETYGYKDPYHTLNGGDQFGGDQYPYWADRAAGRYQFLPKTWAMEQRRLGLKDFSPASQDAAARDYAALTYSQATGGRNLEADLGAGTVDPRGRRALTGVWPGGFNQGFESRYKAALDQDKAPPQPATPIPPRPAVGANTEIPIAPVPSTVLPNFGLTAPPPIAMPTQPQDQQGRRIAIPPAMPSGTPGKQSALDDQNSLHHVILDIRGANSGVKYAMNRAEGPATTEVRVGYAMDNLS